MIFKYKPPMQQVYKFTILDTYNGLRKSYVSIGYIIVETDIIIWVHLIHCQCILWHLYSNDIATKLIKNITCISYKQKFIVK